MTSDRDPILDDSSRLLALQQTGLVDSPPEESFDRLTRLASRFLNAPVALISLVNSERQFFKSSVGLPQRVAEQLAPLSHSFCRHVIATGKPLIVDDARLNPVLNTNLAVPLGVIAYAGMPLTSQDGHTLGSFCVIDKVPRKWTADELGILGELAGCVMTEIDLRQARDVAEAASASKDKFLAFLSHELRGPLTPALLTASAMENDEQCPTHIREEALLIRRNIQLATHMADDLLDVTRLAAGKLEPQFHSTDLHDVIRTAVAQCTAGAKEKSIRITTELRAGQFSIRGDGPRLIQVVQNVLSNSIKFTPQEGSVSVSTANVNHEVLTEIADTGRGVDRGFLSKMFEPYEQADRESARDHLGLGLGLTICRGIVEAHQGTISARSGGKGKGTTIAIRLPLAATGTSGGVVPVIEGTKADPAANRLRIMLVEDHDDTRRVMTRLLKNMKFSVVTASCIAEAVQTAAEHELDLVISDIGLPDGTGLELMQQLLASRPVTAIALTGYGTEADTELTRAAGFTAHLTKPIDFKDLVEVIDRVTRRLPAAVPAL